MGVVWYLHYVVYVWMWYVLMVWIKIHMCVTQVWWMLIVVYVCLGSRVATCVHDVYRGMVHTWCGSVCMCVYIMYIFVIFLCIMYVNTIYNIYIGAHFYGVYYDAWTWCMKCMCGMWVYGLHVCYVYVFCIGSMYYKQKCTIDTNLFHYCSHFFMYSINTQLSNVHWTFISQGRKWTYWLPDTAWVSWKSGLILKQTLWDGVVTVSISQSYQAQTKPRGKTHHENKQSKAAPA